MMEMMLMMTMVAKISNNNIKRQKQHNYVVLICLIIEHHQFDSNCNKYEISKQLLYITIKLWLSMSVVNGAIVSDLVFHKNHTLAST